MRQAKTRGMGRRVAGVMTPALVATLFAGCEVTNPGPVQDEFLNVPSAHQALVNGSGRRLSIALSAIGYSVALSTREILPGGQTGNGGHSPVGQAGVLLSNEVGGPWNSAQQSRWIAEDAIRRFTTVVPAGQTAPEVLTQAYLYAGYAGRLLGENMCDAVFDGGPKLPYTDFFKRAETAFTNAIATAPNNTAGNGYKAAAYAGRASVRVSLKDWTGAVSDAAQVPSTFLPFTLARAAEDVGTGGDDLFYANANAPYRSYTIWKTWFETYYDQTGDPRAGYGRNASFPLAQQQLSGYGAVPWEFQTKYRTAAEPVRLSSYREMVLIRAEAALVAGDMASGMTLINSIRTTVRSDRTGQNLPALTAANITEAWTHLKRERAIEFWLEGRRLGDLRRWTASATPGTIDWPDFEAVSRLFRDNPPSKCFPIPDGEVNTNPNL